jgi:tetratricopeptide (TPR) repeat protein
MAQVEAGASSTATLTVGARRGQALVKHWVVLVIMITCASVRADDREAARQAFRRGSQHYKIGEYKEALAEFKGAYRSYEDPSFLFNIAQCERQLGMSEDAAREYRMYLAESPNAPNRDEVREMIEKLDGQISDERRRREADEAAARQKAPEVASPVIAAPAAPASDNAAALTAAPPPAQHDKPTYKKWWVWTLVGVAVAGGAAAGLAVALTRSGPAPTANTVLGTAHPFN